MRKIFTVLATTLAVAVVGQVFLAGHGVFTGSFHPHRALGMGTLVLTMVVAATGLLARIPRPALRSLGVVVGLIVLQPVLARLSAALGSDSTAVGAVVLGLHAVNGVAVGAMVGEVLSRTSPTAESAAETADEPRPVAARTER